MISPPPYGRPNGPYFHGRLVEPNCDECPLRNDVKVSPDGPVPARLAIVGEEPGDTEVAEGRGFIGPSGQLLWQLCRDAGFEREDVWVTNAALCKAREIRMANKARIPLIEVKQRAARCCRPRLLGELLRVDPLVVIPVGNWALWSISDIPNARIYAYRGSRQEVDLQKLYELVVSGQSRAPMRYVKDA